MNLKDLVKPIPTQWRVQQFSKFKPQASCVAYIDARDVMDRLDEVCGAENWQDKYESIDGKLFAAIGIRIGKGFESPDDWVWKYDTGSESNIEKEKGEVSDSFKRAAVKWGIGRFLYSLPIKYVDANEVNTGNNRPYVIDSNKKQVWDLTAHINKTSPNTTPQDNPTPVAKPAKATVTTTATPIAQPHDDDFLAGLDDGNTSNSPANSQRKERVENQICQDCGTGTIVKNPKTGKLFCDHKCWLNK